MGGEQKKKKKEGDKGGGPGGYNLRTKTKTPGKRKKTSFMIRLPSQSKKRIKARLKKIVRSVREVLSMDMAGGKGKTLRGLG